MENAESPTSSIDDYADTFPPEVQRMLQQVRAVIREAAPAAVETIKYGIPTFVLSGNLVHFAAFKKHVGFYPGPSGIAAFQDEIAPYKSAKGSVQFPLEQPLPLDLIRRIVQFRVREVEEKARRGRRK